jgi:hypothetical protein
MSSITTKKDEHVDKTDTQMKKRTTTTHEEKSRTETQQQSHKVITGTLDELAPYMKDFNYEPNRGVTSKSPPISTAKPVAATETRKMAFTTGGPTVSPFVTCLRQII